MLFTTCLVLSMITLLIGTSTLGIGVYLGLWVFGSSGAPLMEALLITRAFGLSHFATILGSIVVVETIGQIISPTVAGVIFDYSRGSVAATSRRAAAFGCVTEVWIETAKPSST